MYLTSPSINVPDEADVDIATTSASVVVTVTILFEISLMLAKDKVVEPP